MSKFDFQVLECLVTLKLSFIRFMLLKTGHYLTKEPKRKQVIRMSSHAELKPNICALIE